LLAEEAVVIVATVERDVVEDSALAVDVDLVAIGALDDADARGKGEEVFELAAHDGRGGYGLLVQRGGRRCCDDVDQRGRADDDGLGGAGDLEGKLERCGATDGEVEILLDGGGEAALRDLDDVASGLQGGKVEVSGSVGFGVVVYLGIDLIGLERGTGKGCSPG